MVARLLKQQRQCPKTSELLRQTIPTLRLKLVSVFPWEDNFRGARTSDPVHESRTTNEVAAEVLLTKYGTHKKSR